MLAFEVGDQTAVRQSADVSNELQSGVTADTSLRAVFEAAVDKALAVAKFEGSAAGRTKAVSVDAAGLYQLAEVGRVQEIGLAAFNAFSIFVVNAVDIFFVALSVSSQELVGFADQTHFSLRTATTPTTSHQAFPTLRTAVRTKVNAVVYLAPAVCQFEAQIFSTA